jgi:hypothetical protein
VAQQFRGERVGPIEPEQMAGLLDDRQFDPRDALRPFLDDAIAKIKEVMWLLVT